LNKPEITPPSHSNHRPDGTIQEIKTVLIAISATLAALVVHHALEQAQASAGPFVSSKLPDLGDPIPIFQ
jgi:hypothetical protein